MRKEKDFDCVEMKWKIQQNLLREEQELGREEAKRRRRERVLNDPILGPFLTKLTDKKPERQATAGRPVRATAINSEG